MNGLDWAAAWAAVNFLFNAVLHNAVGAFLFAAFLLLLLVWRVTDFFAGYAERVVAKAEAEEEPTPELIAQWLIRVGERAEVAEERLQIGIIHGKANTKVVLIEEELMLRFGGQSFPLADGRIVTIGRPGCRIADRVRLNSSAETAIARLRGEGIF